MNHRVGIRLNVVYFSKYKTKEIQKTSIYALCKEERRKRKRHIENISANLKINLQNNVSLKNMHIYTQLEGQHNTTRDILETFQEIECEIFQQIENEISKILYN